MLSKGVPVRPALDRPGFYLWPFVDDAGLVHHVRSTHDWTRESIRKYVTRAPYLNHDGDFDRVFLDVVDAPVTCLMCLAGSPI